MDPIALTGLIIALIALVIALFQLLQQLLATADGFRNCQGPIMGPWAALTERHFLKREFRYETLFSVPYISMGWCHHDAEQFCVVGGDYSRKKTLCELQQPQWKELNVAGETVRWIFFLDELHRLGANYPGALCCSWRCDGGNSISVPCLRALRRSWDLTSPDVIKPLAGLFAVFRGCDDG
jgi:hypothetical protein